MAHSLSVIAHNDTLIPEPAGALVADRIKLLQAEARGLAREHVRVLEDALARVASLATDIAEGGEAYPVGVRELARRLAEDCGGRAQTLEAIVSRGAAR